MRTITSVATSIAAFFGRASQGPIDKAVRILSLADYERQFGPPHPKSDLAQGVRHFSGLTMDPDSPRYARSFVTDSSELISIAGKPL